jgi:purine catabolism regulator
MRRGAPEVVAGHEALDTRIRWVHSSEVPDIAAHLKGDELLLVTGMGVDRTPRGQRSYVEALAERRIAALVLELGEVFTRAPRAMVTTAAAHDLPLVILHRAVPFIEVTEEIHAEIVHRQLRRLSRADDLQRRFTRITLSGAHIADLLQELASVVANPVVLEGADGAPVFHATHRATSTEVMAAWEATRARRHGLPDAAEAEALAVPLPGGRDTATLIVLALDSPVDDADTELVRRAADVIALATSRTPEQALLATRERGNFLADIAAGRLDADDAAARARALEFEHPRGMLLPVVFAVTAGEPPAGDAERWAAVWRAVRADAIQHRLPIIIGPHAPTADALAVVGLQRSADRRSAADAIAVAAAAAVRRHLGRDESILAVTVGAAVPRWDQLPRALRETIDTAAATRELPHRAWHDVTVADVDRLLWALRDDPRIVAFVEQRLGPILRHDAARSAKLLPTLEALSDHHWNKSDTARALHLNRQALYPRLTRLQRLLDVELDDVSVRIGLDLAIRAERSMRDGTRI